MILGFKKKIKNVETNFRQKILLGIKIHTIREDKPNRWNDTRMIQFVTRGKNFSCEKFAEMPCTGIQKIQIKISEFAPCFNEILIDGKEIFDFKTLTELAQNDGFENFEKFRNWFNIDFEGKIIHWTNKRY